MAKRVVSITFRSQVRARPKSCPSYFPVSTHRRKVTPNKTSDARMVAFSNRKSERRREVKLRNSWWTRRVFQFCCLISVLPFAANVCWSQENRSLGTTREADGQVCCEESACEASPSRPGGGAVLWWDQNRSLSRLTSAFIHKNPGEYSSKQPCHEMSRLRGQGSATAVIPRRTCWFP